MLNRKRLCSKRKENKTNQLRIFNRGGGVIGVADYAITPKNIANYAITQKKSANYATDPKSQPYHLITKKLSQFCRAAKKNHLILAIFIFKNGL